jgi:hypothetical protein
MHLWLNTLYQAVAILVQYNVVSKLGLFVYQSQYGSHRRQRSGRVVWT